MADWGQSEPAIINARTMSNMCTSMADWGQSEPAIINAPVGHSVHWMGCIFSFGSRWGSSQSISFFFGGVDHCIFFIGS
jgi:hypothetical protein